MEFTVYLTKCEENNGYGFSLLGSQGPPYCKGHIIYDVQENSPAANKIEAGDIIVKVNGTDINRYSTKEVLKCLRLSENLVALDIKRDPNVKNYIREYLACSSTNSINADSESMQCKISSKTNSINLSSPSRSSSSSGNMDSLCRKSRIPTAVKTSPSKNCPQSFQQKKSQIPTVNKHFGSPTTSTSSNGNNKEDKGLNQNVVSAPLGKARFEAYVMTGDLILNLSKTPQSGNIMAEAIPKKYSLHQQHNGMAPRASSESTPSSSVTSPVQSESSDSVNFLIKNADRRHLNENLKNDYSNCDNDEDEGQNSSGFENYQQKQQRKYKTKKCMQNKVLAPEIVDDTSSITFSSSAMNNLSHNFINSSENQRPCYSSASTIKSSGALSSPEETSFSVPTSPMSLSTPVKENVIESTSNSLPTSPEVGAIPEVVRRHHNNVVRKCDSAGFRTSKSEDHLQQAQREGMGAVIPIDIDEDVNSSLNTLLDTRHETDDSQSSNHDRIVWTYNAPVPQGQKLSPNSHSSSISTSPQHTTESPASPTSVSSSVMSSNSGSKGALTGIAPSKGENVVSNNGSNTYVTNSRDMGHSINNCVPNYNGRAGGDQSVSEAVSNISSPDYQDDENLLSSRDVIGFSLSDPSDSDSTILVSEAMQKQQKSDNDYKIFIKVKANSNNNYNNSNNNNGNNNYTNNNNSSACESSKARNSEEEITNNSETSPSNNHIIQECSPPVSDDGSDIDSLHSYHYSPKAVDIPSAIRLAKRLFALDGFKKSDVSRHLSKNNDFSRAVADEYLKYFNFEQKTLDQSLRGFLQQFSLSGETQERERVLLHFSKRYLDCNPGTFNSQDAVHTLTCAIMLLNSDLHGQNIGRKMTCNEFVDNLAELNDGDNFPKDILKHLFQAIKSHPLEWALDEDSPEQARQKNDNNTNAAQIGSNPFLNVPPAAIEYKKGYVMRKSCYESNFKKTPFGKRSWKMFYCTLRDLVLYLHKDEHGFRKNQMSDNLHNAIRIHHALATKANDYIKKQHVFRLQTADRSEYLFQTSDSKELQSWIDTINFVCASFSAPSLEGAVGSQKRFQRPLLPSTHTKLLQADQLKLHEQQVQQLKEALNEHVKDHSLMKGLTLQNYREKEAYLQYELKRYQTYVNMLNAKILSDQQLDNQNNSDDLQSRFMSPIVGNVMASTNIFNHQMSECLDEHRYIDRTVQDSG